MSITECISIKIDFTVMSVRLYMEDSVSCSKADQMSWLTWWGKKSQIKIVLKSFFIKVGLCLEDISQTRWTWVSMFHRKQRTLTKPKVCQNRTFNGARPSLKLGKQRATIQYWIEINCSTRVWGKLKRNLMLRILYLKVVSAWVSSLNSCYLNLKWPQSREMREMV